MFPRVPLLCPVLGRPGSEDPPCELPGTGGWTWGDVASPTKPRAPPPGGVAADPGTGAEGRNPERPGRGDRAGHPPAGGRHDARQGGERAGRREPVRPSPGGPGAAPRPRSPLTLPCRPPQRQAHPGQVRDGALGAGAVRAEAAGTVCGAEGAPRGGRGGEPASAGPGAAEGEGAGRRGGGERRGQGRAGGPGASGSPLTPAPCRPR